MIYVLCSPDGALLAWGATEQALPTPPGNSVVKGLASWDEPPTLPFVWTPSLKDWAVPAPVEPILSKLSFRWRYTIEEQVAIKRAEKEHPDPNVRATLEILRESLAEVDDKTGVKVADERTQNGVGFHASVGLIAPYRVAEILVPPT